MPCDQKRRITSRPYRCVRTAVIAGFTQEDARHLRVAGEESVTTGAMIRSLLGSDSLASQAMNLRKSQEDFT
jgi:hypothetical protein